MFSAYTHHTGQILHAIKIKQLVLQLALTYRRSESFLYLYIIISLLSAVTLKDSYKYNTEKFNLKSVTIVRRVAMPH